MSEKQIHYGVKYLIDTDVLINHINSNKPDSKLLKLSEKGGLCINALTIYELYLGINDEELRNRIEKDLKYFEVININADICKIAAEYGKNKHLLDALKILDLLIASSCIVHKYILVTNNVKHFKMIPDIKIYEE